MINPNTIVINDRPRSRLRYIMHNIGQIVGPPLFGYIVKVSSYRIAW
jgi:hypothetical protein